MSGRRSKKRVQSSDFDDRIFIKEEEFQDADSLNDSKEIKHKLLEIEQVILDDQQQQDGGYEKKQPRRFIAPTHEIENTLKPKDEDFEYMFLMSLQPFLKDTPPNKKLAVRIRLIQVLNMENLEFECYKNDEISALDTLDPDSLFLLSLKPMLACVPPYRKLNVNAKMMEIIKKESSRPG